MPPVEFEREIAARVRFVACSVLTLALAGWIAWQYPFDDLLDRSGTPLGADFAMFYVGGQVVLDGDAVLLYDQAEHQRRLQQLFPGIDPRFCLPYRYPPFVAWLAAPLATLPYAAAYGCFLTMSVAAWCASFGMIYSTLSIGRGQWRTTIYLACAGWPVALETLIGGQASMFAMLLVALTLLLIKHRQVVAIGAVLGLAAYKPNVLGLFAVACLVRYPRAMLGVAPVAAIVLAVCWLVGAEALGEYLQLTTSLATSQWDVDTPYWKVHSVAAILTPLVGDSARVACVGVGLALAALLGWHWRRLDEGDDSGQAITLALLLTVNAAFNPYTPIYDLTLLAVSTLLTLEYLARRHGEQLGQHFTLVQLLFATLYFGPHLSQALAQQVGVQLFPIAVVGLGIWQAALCNRLTERHASGSMLAARPGHH